MWSREGFTAQHFFELQALVEIALYEGAGAQAWAAVERGWGQLQSSMLTRVQRIHIECLSFRARAAVAAAVDDHASRPGLLRVADAAIKTMRSLDATHSPSLAMLTQAGAEATRGQRERAVSLLGDAATQLRAIDMPLHAAAATRRLGEMGRAGCIEEADAWMHAHAIRNPAAMTRMLVPGVFGS